ncbi:hemin uptake protein HemP [Rhodopirellula sp. JC740]|uniref:Hemin uptake protein HemP n=1 Tax=Rhodopirellula halodulae TaxID=2894198 RepID=A0ABS8NCH1_9BACT|nr:MULTISPECIES: hemin uptake protein HemP [unclassified Rhodopirellula]MCC9640642.1 hemin uptake protein HemP [Rhodopirellula sp. JC740]MCC9654923.1 hemin uptake protein HemP [Rhodopirellula sp. JC737]
MTDSKPTPANDSTWTEAPAGAVVDGATPVTPAVESVPSATTMSTGGMPKIIRFEALARCGGEIWIENEGQIYRLRKTRQGKLILTK